MPRKANRTETRKFNRVETRYFDGAKWQRYMTKHETDFHKYLRDTYPARTVWMFVDPSLQWAFGSWTEIVKEVQTENYNAAWARYTEEQMKRKPRTA